MKVSNIYFSARFERFGKSCRFSSYVNPNVDAIRQAIGSNYEDMIERDWEAIGKYCMQFMLDSVKHSTPFLCDHDESLVFIHLLGDDPQGSPVYVLLKKFAASVDPKGLLACAT